MEKEDVIRKTILEMEEPFTIVDLFERFSEKAIWDKVLICNIFEELIDSGLLVNCGKDEHGARKWSSKLQNK